MFLSGILIILFFINTLGPLSIVQAQVIHLPSPGVMVHLSPTFTPAHLQGLTIHPDNILKFDFLINRGDVLLNGQEKKAQYTKLVKYFLASLTIPDENQWVTY